MIVQHQQLMRLPMSSSDMNIALKAGGQRIRVEVRGVYNLDDLVLAYMPGDTAFNVNRVMVTFDGETASASNYNSRGDAHCVLELRGKLEATVQSTEAAYNAKAHDFGTAPDIQDEIDLNLIVCPNVFQMAMVQRYGAVIADEYRVNGVDIKNNQVLVMRGEQYVEYSFSINSTHNYVEIIGFPIRTWERS